MRLINMRKAFARKIIHLTGGISQEEVENEVRVIDRLRQLGGHPNIVQVLRHDWLPQSFQSWYYIDMELCAFSLQDYIRRHNQYPVDPASLKFDEDKAPVVLGPNHSPTEKMLNMWTVGTHIVSALRYLHEKSLVHRDLKPGNGKALRLWKGFPDLTQFFIPRRTTIGNSPILVSHRKPHHSRPSQPAIQEEHRVIVHQSYFSTNPHSTAKPTSGLLVVSSMNWRPGKTHFVTTGRYARISMAIVAFRSRFLNARFFFRITSKPTSRNCSTKTIANDLRRRPFERFFILIAGSWEIHA